LSSPTCAYPHGLGYFVLNADKLDLPLKSLPLAVSFDTIDFDRCEEWHDALPVGVALRIPCLVPDA
jgi:hypothetical protein